MTKKAPTPTAQHMQKLADLMDTRPEGVTTRQVQNTLSVSPTLAKAALVEIGAVEVEGKWVFAVEQDDATLEEIGNFVSQPQLKKLTQAVFDGLPSEYRWAVVCPESNAIVFNVDPRLHDSRTDWHYTGLNHELLGSGFDTTDWQNSKIEREPSAAEIYEALAANPPDFDPLIKSVAAAKSDFAVALEAERQRVYDAVAIGGTVERLAELTGLHVDDVQMHLDALIVDGAIYQKPIIVAMSYGVMG